MLYIGLVRVRRRQFTPPPDAVLRQVTADLADAAFAEVLRQARGEEEPSNRYAVRSRKRAGGGAKHALRGGGVCHSPDQANRGRLGQRPGIRLAGEPMRVA